MKKYVVRTTIRFFDYEGKEVNKETKCITREVGSIFKCDRERYLYLKKNNVVELMAILN